MALDNYYSDDEATKAVKKYRAALRNLVAAAGPIAAWVEHMQTGSKPKRDNVNSGRILRAGEVRVLADAVNSARLVLK